MEGNRVRLTSAEIAALWGGYLGDSMANAVLRYFLATVEDAEIEPVIEYAFGLTKEHLSFKNELFEREGFPIPHAFSEEDVNPDAPKLYSDIFMLLYLRQMGISGMGTYAVSLGTCARMDVREFFTHNLKTAAELFNKTVTLLEQKGLLVRAPYIDYPRQVEFVQKEGWLNGLMGDRRALNVAEISHLYMNMMTNSVGKDLLTGFAQVAQSPEVVKLFIRGKEIGVKHLEIFSSLLHDDNLPAPEGWDSHVTDSTVAPFSDKLMLFHAAGLAQLGVSNYGLSLSASMRRDIATHYTRLLAETGTYADDLGELLIKNHWLEKMPGALERDELL